MEKVNDLFALDIVQMAISHIKYNSVETAASKLGSIKCPKLQQHLKNMIALATLHFINDYITIGHDTGFLERGSLRLIEKAQKLLLIKIRPQIIPIVESFIPVQDSVLMSAIGNSYGDIYQTHLEWAKTSKMNQTEHNIPNGYKELILPIL